MKKSDELKPEYDLRRLGQGVRGKYYNDALQKIIPKQRTIDNLTLIDPDESINKQAGSRDD